MDIRFILFTLVMTSVLSGGCYYVGRKMIRALAPGRYSRLIVVSAIAAFISLQWIAPLLYRGVQSGEGISTTTRGVQWLAYGSLGFLASVFFLLLYMDIGLGVAWAVQRLRRKPAVSESRREFFTRGVPRGVTAAAAVVSTVGVAQARMTPSVKEVRIAHPGLAPELDGFTIAQISDLHIGQTIDRSFVERVVSTTLDARPDLIALTGDIADGHPGPLREAAEPLGRLRAPHGVYYITGNHEYYWGADEWVAELTRLGATPLKNEHRVLNIGGAPLVVAGVTDVSGGGHSDSHRSDPARALAGAPEGAFRLMLAHQPKSAKAVAAAGADLQISGHTHAGQFFPWGLVVYLAQPYFKGLYRHDPRLQVYVNAGTGYWGPPNRFGVPSEITLLRLTPSRDKTGT